MRFSCRPFHAVLPTLIAFGSASHAGTSVVDGLPPATTALSPGRWEIAGTPTAPWRTDAGRTAPPFVTETSLRIDVSQSLELLAHADGAPPPTMLESSADTLRRLHGFTDVSLGATWRVRGGDAGWLPGVAWLADVETTTGAPAFRGRDVRPSLRATAEWRLPADCTLGLMPGLYRDRDERSGKRYAAGVLALTLGQAWTPRLRGFVELAGERLSRVRRDAAFVEADTGIAFVASRRVEFDMIVSRTLSSTTPGLRGGLSLSARF